MLLIWRVYKDEAGEDQNECWRSSSIAKAATNLANNENRRRYDARAGRSSDRKHNDASRCLVVKQLIAYRLNEYSCLFNKIIIVSVCTYSQLIFNFGVFLFNILHTVWQYRQRWLSDKIRLWSMFWFESSCYACNGGQPRAHKTFDCSHQLWIFAR